MRIAKRIGAAVLAVCMVACLLPGTVSVAAARMNFKSTSKSYEFEAGKNYSGITIGSVSISGYTDDEPYSYYIDGIKTSTSSSEDWYNDHAFNASVNSAGDIIVSKDEYVKQGTYYIFVSARERDNSDDVIASTTIAISVTADTTNTYISGVSVNMPYAFKVGQRMSEVTSQISVDRNDDYDLFSTNIYQYDKNNKAQISGSTIQADYCYRVVVDLRAKYRRLFGETSYKSDYWNGYYTYTGSVSGAGSVYDTAVYNNGSMLRVGFLFYVDKDGYTNGYAYSGDSNTSNTSSSSGNGGSGASFGDYKISGTTANVANIDDSTALVAARKADTNLIMNFYNQNVDTVKISRETFINIANGINDSKTNAERLEIRLKDSTVVYDGMSLYAIANAAYDKKGGVSINIKKVPESMLNSDQKNAISGKNVLSTVSSVITVGSDEITSLGGGSQQITVRQAISADQKESGVVVYYLDTKGNLVRVDSTYSQGSVTFTSSHNSHYVIIYDENAVRNETPDAVSSGYATVYRAYNKSNGDHLFTTNKNEYDTAVKAGWVAEGTAFKVSLTSGEDVYRLYHAKSGEHLYSLSAAERGMLVKAGWKIEGISFKSNGSVPVFRLQNPNQKTNNHLFTTSAAERDKCVKDGWKYEGEAFRVN